MKEGPDISLVAAMMGDPARANMLMAMMSGMAFTAKELAQEAGISPSTASSHLAQLEASYLIKGRKQGRFRYFALADADIAHAVEALMTVATRAGHLRTRPGPKDNRMREARTCYDHLAGKHAVALFEYWVSEGILEQLDESVAVSENGRAFLTKLGIDMTQLERKRRPVCRTCLDWSERKSHLGGSLGAAVLTRMLDLGWVKRERDSRTVRLGSHHQEAFVAWYQGQNTK